MQSSHVLGKSSILLLSLEVVQQDVALLRLLTPVADDNARAVDDLAGVALAVEHAEAGPLAEHLAVGDLDQRDLVLGAQGDDELLVRLLLARLVQHAHVRLATVEGLGGFAQAAGQAVVDERKLEDSYTTKHKMSENLFIRFLLGVSFPMTLLRRGSSNVERTFQGVEDRHGSRGCGSIAGDFDLIGRGDFDRGSGLFSVRLCEKKMIC